MRWIEAVTDPALSQLGVDELVCELLERLRWLLGVDTATVLLLDHAARQLVVTHSLGIEEEVQQGIRVPMGEGFAGRVAAAGEPVVLDRVDQTTVVNSLLWEKGLQVLLGVPMVGLGRLVGVVHVGSLTQRSFTDEEIHLLRMVADRIALAANSRMSGTERAAVSALQRSLLPTRLPRVADLEFAARYVPGADLQVGGDWYDVLPLPGDRLGIVIGDVMGHGLPAAVIMGRLRSALRSYALLEVDDPALVLDRLDRKAIHFEAGAMATVLYAVVAPGHETVTMAVAGHPPPVLAVPGGQAALIDVEPDPPIGLRYLRRHRNQTVRLPVGSTMCFYTDGLVERRGESIDVGLDRLCDSVTSAPADLVCSHIMRALIGDEESSEDDTALLVMRRLAGKE
ncbi:GAF domain-containing protein [Actinocrispum wychmicini]|uniref:GAF domain-containing protein n=1 Tax=Actinocrispum wychmicini TaxID=1213861 RepID=A0A4R2IR96_9PSEU|nr:GAF domain-containing protein [Actinocrispum wychmicini]